MPHDDLGSKLDGLAAAGSGPPPAIFIRRVTRRRWTRRARVAAPLLAVAVVALVAWRTWPSAADRREVAILPVVSARPESLAALRHRLDAGDPRPGSGGWDGQGTLTPLDGYRAGGLLGAELSQ